MSEENPAVQPSEQSVEFSNLILGFAHSALYHLGEVPIGEQIAEKKDLVAAKQNIDIIDMLQAKTAGNLDSAEQKLMTSILTDLKLKYAQQSSQNLKK